MNALIILGLLIAFPLTELYVLIQVGSEIGGLLTIFLTIATAVIGIFMIRIQGVYTLQKMQSMLQQQQTPAIPIIEGVLLTLAAFFLLIPGFISDALGALLLIPPIRVAIAHSFVRSGGSRFQHQNSSHSDIIDGEYEDISDYKPHIDDQTNKKR